MQKSTILLGLLFFVSYSVCIAGHTVVVEQSVNTQGMSPAQATFHKASFDIAFAIVNRFVAGEELDRAIAFFAQDIKLYNNMELVCRYAIQLMEAYRNQIRDLLLSGTLTEVQKKEFFDFLELRYSKAMKFFANPQDLRSFPVRYTLKALKGGEHVVEFVDDHKLETVEGLTGSALMVAALHQAIKKNYVKAAVLGITGSAALLHLGNAQDYLPEISVNFNK